MTFSFGSIVSLASNGTMHVIQRMDPSCYSDPELPEKYASCISNYIDIPCSNDKFDKASVMHTESAYHHGKWLRYDRALTIRGSTLTVEGVFSLILLLCTMW